MQGLDVIRQQNKKFDELKRAPLNAASPQFVKDFHEAQSKIVAKGNEKSYKAQFA